MIESRIIGAGPADLIGVFPDDELPDVTGLVFAEEWTSMRPGECLFCQGKVGRHVRTLRLEPFETCLELAGHLVEWRFSGDGECCKSCFALFRDGSWEGLGRRLHSHAQGGRWPLIPTVDEATRRCEVISRYARVKGG